MIFIPIDEIVSGMILDSDVRDINTRLLLPKGTELAGKHIRILKMWGIAEVAVDAGEDDGKAACQAESENREIQESHMRSLFRHNDIDHPLIRFLFQLALGHRFRDTAVPAVAREPGADANPRETFCFNDLRSRIQRNQIRLPEIPAIVMELNDIMADPFASADAIAKVVSKSPSLTALLLKIVNSAIYAFPSRIDSISRATLLIGSKEVSQLAMGISTLSIFKGIPRDLIDIRGFIKHSLACGIFARFFGAHCNVQQTEQLFVAGLLHDIGRVIMYQHFPDQSRNLLLEAQREQAILFSVETNCIGYSHSQIGRDLLHHWRLPQTLENIVHHHHHPSRATDVVKTTIVHLADAIANALNLGSSGEIYVPPLDVAACDQLKINPNTIKFVIQQATPQLDHLDRLFQDPI